MKLLSYFLFAVLLFTSCGNSRDERVVVVERTKSYHKPNCGKVNMAYTATVSVADAVAQQMQPCPYCKPDKGI